MTEMPEIGKISPDIFRELIYPRLGAASPDVLIGPRSGVDAAVVNLGGKAVSLTTDPVFIVPEYGWERAAWFAINILLSDSVTSGLKPKYLTIDLNLPMGITKDQLSLVWQVIHDQCASNGVSIVTGHTARYENCGYPFVGGATVIGEGELNQYVGPEFVKPGDKIIITKGPAIEACGIFAAMFPGFLARKFGADFSRKAQDIFYKMSVVEDALVAVSVGVRDNGVTVMHDATECGIWGGLYEIAEAAGMGVTIEKDQIVIEDGVKEICALFGIDPFASISEGTLLLTCRAHKAEAILSALAAKGIKASVAGEITPAGSGMKLVENGQEKPLVHPQVDPFWKAFYNALEKYDELEGKK